MAHPSALPEIEETDGVDAMGASDVYPDIPEGAEVVAQRTQADIEAALSGTIGRLQALADKQVQAKSAIEQRWLEDTRLFHGRYEASTEKALKDARKSRLFVNLTRSKVNSWDARLTDLLFPTDDKNWGIKPVPAPHLSDAVKQSVLIAHQAAQQATQAHQGGDPAQAQQIAEQGNSALSAGASVQELIEAADKSASLMEQEIDTQLKESSYNIRTREGIRDAIKLGTMVMKGPITNQRLTRSWVKQGQQPQQSQSPFASFKGMSGALNGNAPAAPAQPSGQPVILDASAPGSGYVLDLQPNPAPEFVRVDPWAYFPDMSAKTPEEAEFHFERHLWNAKQLRHAVKSVGLEIGRAHV